LIRRDTPWSTYRTPPDNNLDLRDDDLSDKRPVFDPELTDSRLLGDWEINRSAAVIGLDRPIIKSDIEAECLVLRPSYAEAASAASSSGEALLVSANMVDGKGKQFDMRSL
jgi:hypothetical protein